MGPQGARREALTWAYSPEALWEGVDGLVEGVGELRPLSRVAPEAPFIVRDGAYERV